MDLKKKIDLEMDPAETVESIAWDDIDLLCQDGGSLLFSDLDDFFGNPSRQKIIEKKMKNTTISTKTMKHISRGKSETNYDSQNEDTLYINFQTAKLGRLLASIEPSDQIHSKKIDKLRRLVHLKGLSSFRELDLADAVKKVRSSALWELLLLTLRAWSKDSNIQYGAFIACTSLILKSNNSVAKSMFEKGCVSIVLKALQNFKKFKKNVICAALGTLSAMAHRYPIAQRKMGDMGCCEIPILLISHYRNDPDVIEAGLLTLASLASKSEKNRKTISCSRNMRLFEKLVKNPTRSYLKILTASLQLVQTLAAKDPGNQKRFGFGSILTDMLKHLYNEKLINDTKVISATFTALIALLKDNEDNTVRLIFEDAIPVIVELVIKHATDIEIQEYGCTVLALIATVEEGRSRINYCDGNQLACNALKKFASNILIQEAACHLLWMLGQPTSKDQNVYNKYNFARCENNGNNYDIELSAENIFQKEKMNEILIEDEVYYHQRGGNRYSLDRKDHDHNNQQKLSKTDLYVFQGKLYQYYHYQNILQQQEIERKLLFDALRLGISLEDVKVLEITLNALADRFESISTSLISTNLNGHASWAFSYTSQFHSSPITLQQLRRFIMREIEAVVSKVMNIFRTNAERGGVMLACIRVVRIAAFFSCNIKENMSSHLSDHSKESFSSYPSSGSRTTNLHNYVESVNYLKELGARGTCNLVLATMCKFYSSIEIAAEGLRCLCQLWECHDNLKRSIFGGNSRYKVEDTIVKSLSLCYYYHRNQGYKKDKKLKISNHSFSTAPQEGVKCITHLANLSSSCRNSLGIAGAIDILHKLFLYFDCDPIETTIFEDFDDSYNSNNNGSTRIQKGENFEKETTSNNNHNKRQNKGIVKADLHMKGKICKLQKSITGEKSVPFRSNEKYSVDISVNILLAIEALVQANPSNSFKVLENHFFVMKSFDRIQKYFKAKEYIDIGTSYLQFILSSETPLLNPDEQYRKFELFDENVHTIGMAFKPYNRNTEVVVEVSVKNNNNVILKRYLETFLHLLGLLVQPSTSENDIIRSNLSAENLESFSHNSQKEGDYKPHWNLALLCEKLLNLPSSDEDTSKYICPISLYSKSIAEISWELMKEKEVSLALIKCITKACSLCNMPNFTSKVSKNHISETLAKLIQLLASVIQTVNLSQVPLNFIQLIVSTCHVAFTMDHNFENGLGAKTVKNSCELLIALSCKNKDLCVKFIDLNLIKSMLMLLLKCIRSTRVEEGKRGPEKIDLRENAEEIEMFILDTLLVLIKESPTNRAYLTCTKNLQEDFPQTKLQSQNKKNASHIKGEKIQKRESSIDMNNKISNESRNQSVPGDDSSVKISKLAEEWYDVHGNQQKGSFSLLSGLKPYSFSESTLLSREHEKLPNDRSSVHINQTMVQLQTNQVNTDNSHKNKIVNKNKNMEIVKEDGLFIYYLEILFQIENFKDEGRSISSCPSPEKVYIALQIVKQLLLDDRKSFKCILHTLFKIDIGSTFANLLRTFVKHKKYTEVCSLIIFIMTLFFQKEKQVYHFQKRVVSRIGSKLSDEQFEFSPDIICSYLRSCKIHDLAYDILKRNDNDSSLMEYASLLLQYLTLHNDTKTGIRDGLLNSTLTKPNEKDEILKKLIDTGSKKDTKIQQLKNSSSTTLATRNLSSTGTKYIQSSAHSRHQIKMNLQEKADSTLLYQTKASPY